jgi:hypothetical protein
VIAIDIGNEPCRCYSSNWGCKQHNNRCPLCDISHIPLLLSDKLAAHDPERYRLTFADRIIWFSIIVQQP